MNPQNIPGSYLEINFNYSGKKENMYVDQLEYIEFLFGSV